ncbi:inositol monophosphatase family protein [Azospirillum ramasamyi]|uniref:ADP-ribosylglycohydrolase family protein n=1 Tax=Azospirillum ramasamyi TaxID=682998 RepID=A0A2U9SKI7_9PROT|nr:inositol monophosphatase family protein [Azospirillum ramasamyi]AWU98098.1 hypothetical protein DM194_27825 [Azospirillum ramasamyi]
MQPSRNAADPELPEARRARPLRTALGAAIAAAREAGALLRDELYRPGGPRGAGSHAEVDVEAERLLRERLLGACPWNWIGEETGERRVDGCPYWWVVDVHDGTSDFLRGHRGSTVSVAVVRDGVPVLGVVHAFAFPDDRGDQIAWAEGCGPIIRNGEPVAARLKGRALGGGETVFVSRAAAEHPVGNARVVAPARFRPMPSIAYRLALAAVSLNGPCSWDYAAGHALLRAADGVLLDERGRAVTYTREARSRKASCFGGAAVAVAELAHRDWRMVRMDGRTRPSSAPPRRRRLDPSVLDRAQGCLLGQLAGDALGGLVEFLPASTIARRYPGGIRTMRDGGTWDTLAGQPTDDSELALTLARRLAADSAWSDEAVLAAYLAWYRSLPFDIGGTTSAALGAASAAPGRALDAAWSAAKRASQANGSLMRVSPIGIFAAGDPGLAAGLAARDSALTHPHPVCVAACAAYAAAIAVGVAGGSRAEMTDAALAHAGQGPGATAVGDCISHAADAPPQDFQTQQGWVLIALRNAFHRLAAGLGVGEAVTATVMRGGDTDTNAAVAGALVGATAGRHSVPAQWAAAVLTCRPMAEAGARRPRPAAYWPDDALDLAERLLLAGPAGRAAEPTSAVPFASV